MAITERQLRAVGLPTAIITMLLAVQRAADSVTGIAATVKKHMLSAEESATFSSQIRSAVLEAKVQVDQAAEKAASAAATAGSTAASTVADAVRAAVKADADRAAAAAAAVPALQADLSRPFATQVASGMRVLRKDADGNAIEVWRDSGGLDSMMAPEFWARGKDGIGVTALDTKVAAPFRAKRVSGGWVLGEDAGGNALLVLRDSGGLDAIMAPEFWTRAGIGGGTSTSSALSTTAVDIVATDGQSLTVSGDYTSSVSLAYTYVSGPGPTASVTATAAVVGQFYPSIQKRTVRAIVDGSPVSYGDHPYRDRVQLRETYEVATKANLLAWWGAKGDTASPDPDATPSYVVTNTYVFDREGQCTVHTEVTALADVQIDDLAILQAQRAGATDYYIPKAVPFLLGGRSLDYATIEAADLTTTGGLPSVMMTPSRMEADGLGVDRMVALFGQSYVFACGFAPVLAAAPAQRRSNTSVKALEIRGGTDKLYMAGIDRGSFTAARGDSFAFVGYRNVARRSGIKTAAYTVRVGQDAYVYADWHDVQLTDRIDIPAELIGRPFTVVEARNVAILSGSASGAVLVDVSAAGSYAFAVLKF